MNYHSNIELAFRLWVRSILEKELGNNSDAVHGFSFPIKRLYQIAIEEVFRYLMRHYHRAPRETAARILDIAPKTVSRAITKKT